MYLPYLRGRQYELLALRELLERSLIGSHIIPIVEPVKLSSTLSKTLDTFVQAEKDLAVVCNPKVGALIGEANQPTDFLDGVINQPSIIKAHIVNDRSQLELARLFDQGVKRQEIILINSSRNSMDHYPPDFLDVPPRYNLMPYDSSFMRKLRKNRVVLEDKFEKRLRNVDYLDAEDESFSEAHLYYKDDGFVAFSDYSIVGREYSESGFAPFAVAIHIVYFAADSTLRVKHFLSDSNDDISDPAGKFYEAVSKLVQWSRGQRIQSLALRIFEDHYSKGTYPGLGTVKKLSLMHHIEIMSRYLDEVHPQ